MKQDIVHIALVVKDYDEGIEFIRPPKEADYGLVAVFKDLYRNLWDLVAI